MRAWRGQPRSRKWPVTRGTEQELLACVRFYKVTREGPRRSVKRRQRPARPQSGAPSPAVLPSPIPSVAIATPILLHDTGSHRQAGRGGRGGGRRRSGTRGTGVGRKEREAEEEGGEGPTGRRVCVSSSLGRQPQPPPPPPPPPFSKIGFSAPPAKRGLGPAAPIPGAEGRVQAPSLAREGSRDRIRTHVYASSPAPRASSWLPRRPRQVEGWGPSGPAGI